MSQYQLSFWFEHGGFCLWPQNADARERYGYAIKNDTLPISQELIDKLEYLEAEYTTYLDWDCPQNPSPWTENHKLDFIGRSTAVCKQLSDELGSAYQVKNEIYKCV